MNTDDDGHLPECATSSDKSSTLIKWIRIRSVAILQTKLLRSVPNKEEITQLLQDSSQIQDNASFFGDLLIPNFDGPPTCLYNTETKEPVTVIEPDRLLTCVRGTSEQLSQILLIISKVAIMANAMTEESTADPNELSTCNVIAVESNQQKPDNPYQCVLIRCSSIFEARRLFWFASEMCRNKCNGLLESLDSKHEIGLRLFLDIKEEDKPNGNLVSVVKEKSEVFRFRARTDKRILAGFIQCSGLPSVNIDRCTNFSICYGRYVPTEELHSLCESQNVPVYGEAASSLLPGTQFATSFPWPTGHPDFENFNDITGKDECIFFTIDVCISLVGIPHPVSLRRVCRARTFKQDEIFWLVDRRPVAQDFKLTLVEHVDEHNTLVVGQFVEAVSIDDCSQVDGLDNSTQTITSDDDENEPLMSGNGIVLREVTDDQLLEDWGQLVIDWHAKIKQDPSSLSTPLSNNPTSDSDSLLSGTAGPEIHLLGSALCQRIRRLVSRGVPDVLRGEVWQLLASLASAESDLMDAYRILITKPCKHDTVIHRDLTRTFPAHDFFKSTVGQEYLLQVSRAYTLYDPEVGYCQGLTFVAAVILLHMPVEQAFALLVSVSNRYGLRELFVDGFDGLHMRLYQLQRLINDQLPDIARHFAELKLETHMYASQWFLTLFTAKFPLNLVFHIIDLFLTEGMIFIFKVAITILRLSRRDLLGLDFEGVLKHLRVVLPKRYMSQEITDVLLSSALTTKVTASKLLKYAREYTSRKEQEKASESPTKLLQNEVDQLKNRVKQLEQENSMLASGVINSKASMHEKVDKLEDKADSLSRELFASHQTLTDTIEEKTRLESEVVRVKQMLREMLEKSTAVELQSKHLTQAHKSIIVDLLKRVHHSNISESDDVSEVSNGSKDFDLYSSILWSLLPVVSGCNNCRLALEMVINSWKEQLPSQNEEDQYLCQAIETHLSWMVEGDSHQLPEKSSASSPVGERTSPSNIIQSKTKQWISNTLNSLRSKTSIEPQT